MADPSTATNPGMNPDMKGWFVEVNDQWPGQAMAMKVDKVLFEGSSDFQRVGVYETSAYGTMMTLDGVIQSTQRDEHAYHEMIAHIPMFLHPNPQHVCIIGGGDGGVMREVVRHPSVISADNCDIDGVVVEQSKVHLKHLSCGFEHPKSHLTVGDGLAFISSKTAQYDVVIVDSSDPDGPAGTLFGETFYKAVHKALKPGGIVCSQGECMWLHLDLIKSMMDFCGGLFGTVGYAYTTIPTYPSGQIGFLISAKEEGVPLHKPVREPEEAMQEAMKYYSPEIHSASFVLPEFARKKLGIPRQKA
eukprot:CAMPEP_0173394556 /NCGR_PEP_ID=MMETSP1356-20130122/28137_1 /TAXON_ID=77927 ORGANISM="Hemiselmis virescens, Strain PCC157" /NCGR_SAMPLE_ID=MMETSP1356 /ASSEMBLY_ACC=CAM_ASM_000847 /LENGTH=302 /DNA_ID=CAMNT_0014352969 /DNA_START=31 /DNA_END=939 /DNA_ORIENTATION=+